MKEKIKQIASLLKERRIWAGIVGALAITLSLLNAGYQIDVPILTNLLTSLGGAVSAVIMATLALWSYLRPKK